jgi:hypothetical protein
VRRRWSHPACDGELVAPGVLQGMITGSQGLGEDSEDMTEVLESLDAHTAVVRLHPALIK